MLITLKIIDIFESLWSHFKGKSSYYVANQYIFRIFILHYTPGSNIIQKSREISNKDCTMYINSKIQSINIFQKYPNSTFVAFYFYKINNFLLTWVH